MELPAPIDAGTAWKGFGRLLDASGGVDNEIKLSSDRWWTSLVAVAVFCRVNN